MSKIKTINNPWMRDQIAGTNGQHYKDQINKIDFYPRYSLPIPSTKKLDSLMLEIGTGWGRWLVSGFQKGYIPVGIDVKVSHVDSVMQTMREHDMFAYMVVTDLANLPFISGVFDFVWSFSSIQHVHYDKAISCLHHINRLLCSDGFTLLEFPNRNGIHNRFGPVQSQEPYRNEPEGLMVRYYTPEEYKQMFLSAFGNVASRIHSFLGIGVLPEDLKYVTWRRKPLVAVSLLATALAKFVPGAEGFADSLYFDAIRSEPVGPPEGLRRFLEAHKRGYDNLNIVHLLQCPYTGGELLLQGREYLISPEAGLKFPIINGYPTFHKRYQENI